MQQAPKYVQNLVQWNAEKVPVLTVNISEEWPAEYV